MPTIPDFADISDIRQMSIPDFPDYEFGGKWKMRQKSKLCDRGTGTQQFRELVMSEVHRRRPRRYKFEFSFVGNDRRPSQKSATRRENRNAPDSPDLSQTIGDMKTRLKPGFHMSGKIPDGVGFCCFPTVQILPTNENSKS